MDLAERLAHAERLGRERLVKLCGQREALRAQLVWNDESSSLAFEIVDPVVPEGCFYSMWASRPRLRRR